MFALEPALSLECFVHDLRNQGVPLRIVVSAAGLRSRRDLARAPSGQACEDAVREIHDRDAVVTQAIDQGVVGRSPVGPTFFIVFGEGNTTTSSRCPFEAASR